MTNTFYQGAHRRNLADNSDIEALEEARRKELNPEPEIPAEVQEVAPNPEDLPPPTNVEEETFKKRYSDLRRHLAAKEKEWGGKFASLEARLNELGQAKIALPSADAPDEVAAWMQQYPDVARIVIKIAETQAEAKTQDVKKQLEQLEKARRATAREKAELKIVEKHSDFYTLRDSEDFHAWASEQPKFIQDALYNNESDFASVIRAIDLYKADKKAVEAPKRGRPPKEEVEASMPTVVKGNVEPQTVSGKKTFKESEIQRMNGREYDRLEAEIMLARAEGRIIYDLSQRGASM
jgi:hypothetical protein